MSIRLLECFRCEYLIKRGPGVINMLLMVLLRASLALLVIGAIISFIWRLMISTISPSLRGSIVSASVISPATVVLGGWLRKTLCCRCSVWGITTRSIRPPSLVIHRRSLETVLVLVSIVVGLGGVLLRAVVRGIMSLSAIPRMSLVSLVVVLSALLLVPTSWPPAVVGKMAASSAMGAFGNTRAISYEMIRATASVAGEATLLRIIPDCIVMRGLLGVHHVHIHFGLGHVDLRRFGLQFVHVAAGTGCEWLVGLDEPACELEQCLKRVVMNCALFIATIR